MEKKIVLIYPSEAVGLIADLGNGEPTGNGDRTSRYIDIAKGCGEKMGKTVKVALIEEKALLPQKKWGYALHVINDVDMTNCRLFRTIGLSEDELIQLLSTILEALEKGEL